MKRRSHFGLADARGLPEQMARRDFFAFCAALKPVELRAIGDLSWVRNLAQGEVLYSPGERGNALYIVNRGLLEILPQRSSQKEGRVYLSKGDVVGEVEVFADLARLELVRAQEAASLQCFPNPAHDVRGCYGNRLRCHAVVWMRAVGENNQH